MTEAELTEASGLVARFYMAPRRGMSADERWAIQLRLLALGVTLDKPMLTPDPRAPQGGTTLALRAA